jgi:magnesium transporter
VIVDCAHYRDGKRQNDGPLSLEEAAVHCVDSGEFVWLGLKEPSDDELRTVGEMFGLHELATEDAADAHERPKMEEYDDSLFVVLKTTRYDDAREEVDFGEIDVFVGEGYVITVRHGEASELHEARRQLEARQELLEVGPAAVVWAIIDKVVDDYAPVVDGIDNDISEVEQAIFGDGADSTQRIYFLKREVIEFHRAVAPLLAPLEGIQYGARPQIPDELRNYFRDIHDHARRVDETVMAQRELLTSILEANLALLGVQQNQIVRAISAWVAILGVPTFLASVWGMNFEHMPELAQTWGYPAALALMAVAVLVLYRFFKRIEWL